MADEILQTHEQYEIAAPKWKRVGDAVAGGDAIKKGAEEYLPKPSAQDDEDYAAYIKRARWYDVTDRTLIGLVGAVFRREPQIEAPTNFEDQLDDLSVSGSPWITTTREITRWTIGQGRVGVLVDRPPETVPVGIVPNVSIYAPLAIRDWSERRVLGRNELERVVLEEKDETDPKGNMLQYRELLIEEGRYIQRIWRKDSSGKMVLAEEIVPIRQGTPLDFIPFCFFGPNDLNPDVEKPPLLGLADENIGHYQLSADYRQSLFLTAQPTPYATGAATDERPSAIGSGTSWFFADPNAKVGMLEFTGSGIDAIRQAMLDSEVRMVLLGARFFEVQKKAAEAAETLRLRFSSDSATLMTIARTVGEGCTKVLQWAADWAGIPSEDIVQTMNDDFVAMPLEPKQIEAYLKAWQSGAIAYTDLFNLLQRGDVIAEDREEDEVRNEVETTPPTIPPSDEPDDDEDEEDEGAEEAA